MKAEDLLRWFTEELLPALVQKGTFLQNESDQCIEKCHFEHIERGVNSFASAPSFVQLIIRTKSGLVSRNILVKFQSQDPEFREKMKLTLQFQNEVTMYNEIIPEFSHFLQTNDDMLRTIVPLSYFASFGDGKPEKSIVILEDLRPNGFKLAESVTELDLNHCLIAFEKLARFHAISYAMKFQKKELFDKLKEKFVHVWHSDDQWTRKQCEDFKGCTAQRGLDYLLSNRNSEIPAEYLNNLKKLLKPEGLFDFLKELHSPKEPLSVICHGDFNRNNILFKYNENQPSDARLIDFQTFLYGSPCLDLSFFTYMNTTLEFREKHFDAIFEHYHSTLIKTVSCITKESEESVKERLPLNYFKDEFARVAITAYVTVSFFLPIMLIPTNSDFEVDMKEKSFRELALENYNLGGEEMSKRVAEVILDFYRRKFYT